MTCALVISRRKPIWVTRQKAAWPDSRAANQGLTISWWTWPCHAKAIHTLTSGKQIFDFGIRQCALARTFGGDERHLHSVVARGRLHRHLMLDGAQQKFFQAHAAQRRRSLYLAKDGIGNVNSRAHKIQISIKAVKHFYDRVSRCDGDQPSIWWGWNGRLSTAAR